MATLTINDKVVTVDVPADTPLLWTIRDEIGLTGTKFGCGMALCGVYENSNRFYTRLALSV
jgi:isoquinoline 1-oxidoreductase alpha subunit